MFERYTEKARRIVFYARFETSRLGSPYIEAEHLLLGLAEDSDILSRFLPQILTETLRDRILANSPTNPPIPTNVDLPLSKESKRVLAFAAEEADRLGHKHIAPEHLLLGLLREKDCFAAHLLKEKGAELPHLRKQIGAAPSPAPFYSGPGQRSFSPAAYAQHDAAESDRARTIFGGMTEKARRSIFFARYDASYSGSPSIESEHLLLGMWRDSARTLNNLMELSDPWPSLRATVEEHSPRHEQIPVSVDLPLSEEVKRVLVHAAEESHLLDHPHIGIEHLLLGLLREEDSFAARLLRKRGAEIERIRAKLGSGNDAQF